MKHSFVFACSLPFLAALWAGCSSSSSSGGSCAGEAPAGTTCQKAGGGCEGLVCQGSTWGCPSGDTQVALTATSCPAAGDDGGGGASSGGSSSGGSSSGGASEGGASDGGSCTGAAPAGATCQKAGGGCEGLVCIGTAWKCPSGDTQVALTATSCTGDGGGAGDSGAD